MNERIRELAREAELLTHTQEGIPTKLEKFAELIVWECVFVIAANPFPLNGEWGELFDEGCRYSVELIKKHFGVEE